MFAILDTNHLREFVNASEAGRRLKEHLIAHQGDAFTCIVVVEESVKGWLALLHRAVPGPDQVHIYERMQESLQGAMKLGVLPFDADAAALFVELRQTFRRIGTMDLKIAAICLVHDATLLTRNIVDFQSIPGLRVENWLDD